MTTKTMENPRDIPPFSSSSSSSSSSKTIVVPLERRCRHDYPHRYCYRNPNQVPSSKRNEDVGESSRPSSSQQQQQHQHHSSTAMTSNQNAGLDDGDSGLLGRPLLLLCLPMREIRVPSLRRGIPRPPSQHR